MEDLLESWVSGIAHEETIDNGNEYVEVEEDVPIDFENEHEIVTEHNNHQASCSGVVEQNMLVTRDGQPVFTLNLPELMSKMITFSDGANVFLCFSKRCIRQLAFDGYIYTIAGEAPLNPDVANHWRCANMDCPGAVRTSANFEELRIRTEHGAECRPDDAQVRLRITVYDLRLMAEFTDISLQVLYDACVSKVSIEHPDIAHLFPPLNCIIHSLAHHRHHKVYRKRFENQKTRWSEHSFVVSNVVGKGRLFSKSYCGQCRRMFVSTQEKSSQDIYIEHLHQTHGVLVAVDTYTFPSNTLCEQWVKAVFSRSRQKLRKYGIFRESMYYLCTHDERLRSGSKGEQMCSAFLRIHDWRKSVMTGNTDPVVVDYCLDHVPHSNDTEDDEICSILTPEAFMADLEERRARTHQLMDSLNLQRVRRFNSNHESQMKRTQDSNNVEANGNGVCSEDVDNDDSGREEGESGSLQPGRNLSSSQPAPDYVTQPDNFSSHDVYKNVLQVELCCEAVKNRMQSCRCEDVAKLYLHRLYSVLDDILADPRCAPKAVNSSDGVQSAPSSQDVTRTIRTVSHKVNKKVSRNAIQPLTKTKEENVVAMSKNRELAPKERVFLKMDENGSLVPFKMRIDKGQIRKRGNSSWAGSSAGEGASGATPVTERRKGRRPERTSTDDATPLDEKHMVMHEDASDHDISCEPRSEMQETPTVRRGRGRPRKRLPTDLDMDSSSPMSFPSESLHGRSRKPKRPLSPGFA